MFLTHSINVSASFCTGVLLFSLKYRSGAQCSLFVFTMALRSSDVIRLESWLQQHLVTRPGRPAVAFAPSTSRGARLVTQTGPPFCRDPPIQHQQPAFDPPPSPLVLGVRYIQQVQIRLVSNIQRAGATGSPASAHEHV